ncbi:MAG: PQQ-binding-like beta-propeller repeat protein [Phycisphaerae bacterium]
MHHWFSRQLGVGLVVIANVSIAVGDQGGGAVRLASDSAKTAADWPNFRGQLHDGISREANLRIDGEQPLPFLWDAEIGSAFSSFAVVNDRVYTCGATKDAQVLVALEAKTGKQLWQCPIGPPFKDSYGDGTRATPTVDDGRVYILGAHGHLRCVNAETGKVEWGKDFQHAPNWGYSASVLVDGDLAITTAGMEDGSIVAFDKRTGEARWKAGNDPVGYSTPYPFTFEGQRYVAGFTGKRLIVVRPNDGSVALEIPWETAWDVNAAAPIFHDGYLLVTSGYRTGAGVFRLSVSGDRLSAENVWKSRALLNKFQSCILRDGYLYTSDQKELKCVEFVTGRKAWNVPKLKHGTLVLAKDHLYFLTDGGELQVAPASPLKFEPTMKAEILTGRCWTVSVIQGGRLFARNLDRVVCFDLSNNAG